METPGDTMSVPEHHQVEKEISLQPLSTLDVGESYLDIPTPHWDAIEVPSTMATVTEDPKPELSPELQTGYRLLLSIMSTSKSIVWPFLDPVDVEKYNLWDYHERIKEPMWLRKMESKFENREYNSVTEFVRDFRLMLENCYRYNSMDHWVSKQGTKLERILEQKLNLQSRHIREKTTHFLTSNGRYGEDESNNTPSGLRRRSATRSLFGLDNSEHSPIIAYIKQAEELREIEEKRQREREKKEEIARIFHESIDWEASLFEEPTGSQFKSMWEIPQVGHFLYICQSALNVGEIPFYELERGFMMPRESSSFAKVITSLLSTPFQRLSLNKKPPMPYGIWAIKLRERVRQWYKVVEQKSGNTIQAAAQLGIDATFFKVLGKRFKLDKQSFHELTLYQKVWIIKSLIETLVDNHQAIRECINSLPLSELHAITLGHDEEGNTYIHFPHFCGADVRIYRQAPIPDPFAKPPRGKRKKKEEKEKKKRGRKRKKEVPVQEEKSHKVRRKRTPKPVTPVVRERPSRLRQRIIPVIKPVHQGFEMMDYESTTSEREEKKDSKKKKQAAEEESKQPDDTDHTINGPNCQSNEETQEYQDTSNLPSKSAKHKKRHKKQKGKKKRKKTKTKHIDESANSEGDNVGCESPERNNDDDGDDDDRMSGKDETEGNGDKISDMEVSEIDNSDEKEMNKDDKGDDENVGNKEVVDKNCEVERDGKVVCDDVKQEAGEENKDVKEESMYDSKECKEIGELKDCHTEVKSEKKEDIIKIETVKTEESLANCVKDEKKTIENDSAKQECETDVDDKKTFTDMCKTETDKVKNTELCENEDKMKECEKEGSKESESKEKIDADEKVEANAETKPDGDGETKPEDGDGETKPEAEKEEEEEQEELLLPEIGPFELVVDGLDSLKEFVAKFAEPEPEPETLQTGRGKKKKIEKPPARKRCVVELYQVLCNLLAELEPWEARIEKAVSRNRMKLKKEWDDFRNQPPPSETVEDVWASEESSSEDSSDEDSSDDSDEDSSDAPEEEKAENTATVNNEVPGIAMKTDDNSLVVEGIVNGAIGDGRPTTRRQARLNKEREKRRIRAARAREKKKQEQEQAKAALLSAISTALASGTTTITLPTTSLGTQMSLTSLIALLRAQPGITVSRTAGPGPQVPITTLQSTITAPAASYTTQVTLATRTISSTSSTHAQAVTTTGSSIASQLLQGLPVVSATANQPVTATKVTQVNSGIVMSTLPISNSSFSPTKQVVTKAGNTATVTLNAPTVAQQLQIQRMQKQLQQDQGEHDQLKSSPQLGTASLPTSQASSSDGSSPQKQQSTLSPVKSLHNLVLDTKTDKPQANPVARDQLMKLLQSPQLTSQQKQLIHLQLLQDQLKNQQVTMAQQKLKLQQTSQRVNQQKQQVLAQSQQQQSQNTTTNQQQQGREQLLQMLPTQQLQLNTQLATTSNLLTNSSSLIGNTSIIKSTGATKVGNIGSVITVSPSAASTSASAIPVAAATPIVTAVIGKQQQQQQVSTQQVQPGQQISSQKVSTLTQSPQYVLIGGKLIPYASLLQQGIRIQGLAQPQQQLKQQPKQQIIINQQQTSTKQPPQQQLQQQQQQQQSTNLVYYVKPQTGAVQVQQVPKTSTPAVVTQRKITQTVQPTVTITKEQKQVVSPVPAKQQTQQIKLSPEIQKPTQQLPSTQVSLASPQIQTVPMSSIATPQSPIIQTTTTGTTASGTKVTGMIGNKMVTITGIDPKLLAQCGGKLVLPNNIILTGNKMAQPQKIMLTSQTSTGQSPQRSSVSQVSPGTSQIQQSQLLLAPASSQPAATSTAVVVSPPRHSKAPEQSLIINTTPTTPGKATAGIGMLSPSANTITIPSGIVKLPTSTQRSVASLPGQPVTSNVVTNMPLQQIIASTASPGKSVYLISSTGSGSAHNLATLSQSNLKILQLPTGKQPIVPTLQKPTVQEQISVTPQNVTSTLSGSSVVTATGIKPMQSYQTSLANVKPSVSKTISSQLLQQSITSQASHTASTISPQTIPILRQNQTLAQIKSTAGIPATSVTPVVSTLTPSMVTLSSTASAPSVVQIVNGNAPLQAQSVTSNVSVNKVPSISFLPAASSVLTQGQKPKTLNNKPLTLTIPGSSTVSSVVNTTQNMEPKTITIPIPIPIPQSPTVQNLHIVSPQNQAMGNVCVSPVAGIKTTSLHVTSPGVGNQGFFIQNPNDMASLSTSSSSFVCSPTGTITQAENTPQSHCHSKPTQS
ncbi:uncharacterized protein LOC144434134 [Glandiceps talaboti]